MGETQGIKLTQQPQKEENKDNYEFGDIDLEQF
jgi:hypothetical protein